MLCVVSSHLIVVFVFTGQFQEAIEEHRQELGICQGLGDVIGCAVANRKIGECFAELGNYEAALKVSTPETEEIVCDWIVCGPCDGG